MTQSEKNRELDINARIMGKNIKAITDFIYEGKRGKAVVYATQEGNFLSPKAVENLLTSHESKIREEERERIKDVLKTRIEVAECCMEEYKKGNDLGSGEDPEEAYWQEMSVKIALETILKEFFISPKEEENCCIKCLRYAPIPPVNGKNIKYCDDEECECQIEKLQKEEE